MMSNEGAGRLGWLGLSVFATGILYYCFAYLLRVYPNVIAPELLLQYDITAQGLGLLASFYYFAYAPMQIPVGLAVDKIGARKSLLFGCLIATTGTLLFAFTNQYQIAILGRFLIGMGASFAYVTALKINSLWLPKKYFATATGLVTGSGMIVAILTEIGLTSVVHNFSGQAAMQVPCIVGGVLLILIFLFIKDKKPDAGQIANQMTGEKLLSYLKDIFKDPQMWLIGIVGSVLYLPATVFADLWAIPYLTQARGFTKHEAAYGISIMLAGWILAAFTSGGLSDYLRSRKMPLMISAVGSLILICIILYYPQASKLMVFASLFFLGLFAGPHHLCFTLSKENYSNEMAGTAVAFANFLIMMGGFIFQPLVGKILDLLWDGSMQNGIVNYSPENFAGALSIIPINLVIGMVLLYFVKETAR